VCCLEMTSKRKLIGRLVPCRCFRGEEEIVSVLDYSHCGLQQVPKEVFNFERTLEELYLDANQIEELPKHRNGAARSLRLGNTIPQRKWKFLWDAVPGSGVTAALGSSLSCFSKQAPLKDQPLIPVGYSWKCQGIQDFPENIKCCKCLTIIEASVNPVSK
ncbi:LRRC7 protein, partial [Hirundo rustica]|nr:LRRC7 protein [Hirundo rustica]